MFRRRASKLLDYARILFAEGHESYGPGGISHAHPSRAWLSLRHQIEPSAATLKNALSIPAAAGKIWTLPMSGLMLTLASAFNQDELHAETVGPSSNSLIGQQENAFLEEVKKDPLTAVVGLFALPLLSLTVGYQPDMQKLADGVQSIEDSVPSMQPWELSILLWGFARIGLRPSPHMLKNIENSLQNVDAFTVEDATAVLWAMCMLDCMSEDLWGRLMSRLAKFSEVDFDEASVLHLIQGSMMYCSRKGVAPRQGDPRASKIEVEKALSSLHWRVVRLCGDKYSEYVPLHPYLEGPYMTLLFMMQKLHCFKGCGERTGAYDAYFKDVSAQDLDWAKKTLGDSRKLSQLKRELFYQWRGNEIVDGWQEAVNEVVYLLTRRLGDVVAQPPDCDIVVPQKRVALFIEDDRPRQSIHSLAEASEGMLHLFGTETATPTSGFALHESVGTNMAKRKKIQERGWRVVVIRLSDWAKLEDPLAKQKFLQEAIASGGLQQGMSSLFQSAVRRG
ncbi:hypothetical protein BSKO_12593 [Bryopsis sp. KO-2023]|nr:hypothetical protein BSKO_12593 [Bryopsis sp. KO-2023]